MRKPLLASLLIFAIYITGMAQTLPERYHTYQEVLDTLATLRDAFPQILVLDTMGYSTRDNIPMLRLKISDNPAIDEDEPAVFYCGGVHADEVLSVEVVLNFAQDIIRRYSQGDTQAIRYINTFEIFVVPFINPEGHLVVEQGNLAWRKNKCDNDRNGIFDYHDGVDNNRNYDFGWSIDTDPSATTPESLMYRGTAPFTQTENIAMAAFAWKYRPIVALDYHSPTYGRSEVAYYPWYWYANQGGHGMSPDEALMRQICDAFCLRITNDAGDSCYQARRALVDKGDFKTYFYGNFGTVSFSVEVSDTTIQNPAMVDGIVARHLPGQYYLLSRALGPGITGIIRDSITLEPLEAEVQVLERINADINPRLSRPDFGRYRRVLAPGNYNLRFLKNGYRTKQVAVTVGANQPTEVNVLLGPINPRPPAPQLIFPSAGDTLNPDSVSFDWGDSPYASRYLIEVALDSMFSWLIVLDSNVAVSAYPSGFTFDNGRYFWRVKGGNNYGWGPYSVKRDFFVETPSAIESAAAPAEWRLYQNYPNPFNLTTNIMFELPADAAVKIEVFDITGRRMAFYDLGTIPAGRHNFKWNGLNEEERPVSSGIYFYRVQAGDVDFARKMLLIK